MPEPHHPMALLETWLGEARAAEVAWSDAFTIATVGASGAPSARAVVLRRLDQRGLVFFTDEGSGKGRDLAERPLAAAVFLWPVLRQQVRVEGLVAKLSDAEADTIFADRPAEVRLSLWAWRQGEVVADAAELEHRLQRTGAELGGGLLSRPPYWSGYRLDPAMVEFWRERAGGLHERIRHVKDGDSWVVERLAP